MDVLGGLLMIDVAGAGDQADHIQVRVLHGQGRGKGRVDARVGDQNDFLGHARSLTAGRLVNFARSRRAGLGLPYGVSPRNRSSTRRARPLDTASSARATPSCKLPTR